MRKINTESYGLEKIFPDYSFELGRSLVDRLQTLWDSLSEDERFKHKEEFERYNRNSGVIFEIDSNNPERIIHAKKEYEKAMQYLDRVFFFKFSKHLVLYPLMMGLEEFPTYEASTDTE